MNQVLLSVAVLAAGAGVTGALYANRPEATQAPVTEAAVPVEVLVVQRRDRAVTVRGMGLVQPARQVVLQPEVNGRVIQVHPALVRGGRVAAGDVLMELDPRDYKSALASQRAAVAQARVALAEEQASKRVAEYEWKGETNRLAEEARAVALREPHIQSARAGVDSASGQLKRAKRNLSRTRVVAPFDAVVLDEGIDIGQVVSPQSPVATLAGLHRFWVEVSLPVHELRMLSIPGVNTDEKLGSSVRVLHHMKGDVPVERWGNVERLIGAVDDRGKMAQVLVAVEDPLSLAVPPADRPVPLLIGTFVEVEIEGVTVPDATAIPATAVGDEDRVWVVGEGDRLERREVDVAWGDDDVVLVSSGLEPGDRVVTSPLAVATPGMAVSVQVERSDADPESPVGETE